MKTGIELIAEERKRQIEKEGYTAEHDKLHSADELARAGACYGLRDRVYIHSFNFRRIEIWPWNWTFFKPTTNDRRRELVKMGALAAAAVDRLNQEDPKHDNCEFLGECENCGVLFFEGDEYEVDNEGIYLCKPCMKACVEENKAADKEETHLFNQRNKTN